MEQTREIAEQISTQEPVVKKESRKRKAASLDETKPPRAAKKQKVSKSTMDMLRKYYCRDPQKIKTKYNSSPKDLSYQLENGAINATQCGRFMYNNNHVDGYTIVEKWPSGCYLTLARPNRLIKTVPVKHHVLCKGYTDADLINIIANTKPLSLKIKEEYASSDSSSSDSDTD
jgi:hypothetical protein